jgi:hypothetical protein
MHRILVSYLPGDGNGRAKMLADELVKRFSPSDVQVVTTAQPQLLLSAAETCHLLILIVGKTLASEFDREPDDSKADPGFPGRHPALQAAHRMGLRPAPLLIGLVADARLAEGARGFGRQVEVSTAGWDADCARLADEIQGTLKFSEYFRDGGASPPSPPGAPAPVPRMKAPKKSRSEPPGEPQAQPVWLGASAPAAVRPGDEFTARFVAYPKEEEAAVQEILKKLSPGSQAHVGLKACRWKPGTHVKVTLAGRGLIIANPSQEFDWEGSRVLLDFDVQAAPDAVSGVTILKFDAMIDGIVVANLRMDLTIGPSSGPGQVQTQAVESARTAFASYSSQDRPRVLDRVAAVRISAGLDVFLDCLSLHPGEEWKPRLAQEIHRRDLFLLFWSERAAQSRWVAWEWQTALASKGKTAMQVHPLEVGAPPPEELKDLHFGDVFMLIRTGFESTAKET